jgi:hypothetical protein
MLTNCDYCRFYIQQDDEFCLNCGTATRDDSTRSLIKLLIIASPVCVAAAYLIVVISENQVPPDSPFIARFILIFCFLLMSVVGCFELFYNRRTTPKLVSTLYEKQKIIENRVNELNARSQKIDAVLDKIKQTDSPQLQDVRAKLLSARELVASHLARYELQRRKIELVRLQNGISAYLSEMHRLSEIEMENGLKVIERTTGAINHIRQNLTRPGAIDFPKKVLPEKESFLSQLVETEASCRKLREALLASQAMQALRGIEPLQESLHLPNTKDLAHSAETFNAQTTLTDFSESFDELEREYKRLKAEDELVAGKLLGGE